MPAIPTPRVNASTAAPSSAGDPFADNTIRKGCQAVMRNSGALRSGTLTYREETGRAPVVPVGGKTWPVMPPPEPPGSNVATQFDQLWIEFNTGNPPPLLTAFGNWISNGKKDDSPQSGPLTQPGLLNNPPPPFPMRRQRCCSSRASRRTTVDGSATARRRAAQPRAGQLLGDVADLPL
jgi:hypothetical protein